MPAELFPAAPLVAVQGGIFDGVLATPQFTTSPISMSPGCYQITASTSGTYTITFRVSSTGSIILSRTFTGTVLTVNLAQTTGYIEVSESSGNGARVRVERVGDVFLTGYGSGTVFRLTTSGVNGIAGTVNMTLVGGGTGGQAGSTDGGYSNTAAGDGGSSGKVLNVGPVTLNGGETVTIGAAGNGGVNTKQAGNAGGETSLGNFTSANGTAGAGGAGLASVSPSRIGNPGSASASSTVTSNVSNNLLPAAPRTTGGGGAGSWNFGVGAAAAAGGGSGIGTGGIGGADTTGGNANGYGGGGGGGGARYAVHPGGNGTPGVIYMVVS